MASKLEVNPVTGELTPIYVPRFNPTGNISAQDIQNAIAEVDSEKLAKAQNLADLADKSTARTNLEAAKNGVNTDITSLQSVTAIAGDTTNRALIAKGATNQTANIFDVQRSSGGILTSTGIGGFGGSLFQLYGQANTRLDLQAFDGGAGNESIVQFDTMSPNNGGGQFRFFRTTNTTGGTGVQIHRADNTSNVNTFLGANTSSYLNALVGNIGIGTSITPAAKFQVTGGVAISSSTAAAADPGAGNLSVSGDILLSNLKLRGAVNGTTDLNNSGNLLDLNIFPVSATNEVGFRLFRATNNTGNTYLDVMVSNNTSATNCRVSGRGNSWFNAFNGNIGFGTVTPGCYQFSSKGVSISSSSAAAPDPGAGNLSIAGRTATGGLRVGARIVTTNTAITTAGCLLYIDASTSNIDLTLPTAIGNLGTLFILIRTDNSANIVRVLTSVTAQTINNSTNPFTIPGGASFNFSSNDANWFVF